MTKTTKKKIHKINKTPKINFKNLKDRKNMVKKFTLIKIKFNLIYQNMIHYNLVKDFKIVKVVITPISNTNKEDILKKVMIIEEIKIEIIIKIEETEITNVIITIMKANNNTIEMIIDNPEQILMEIMGIEITISFFQLIFLINKIII